MKQKFLWNPLAFSYDPMDDLSLHILLNQYSGYSRAFFAYNISAISAQMECLIYHHDFPPYVSSDQDTYFIAKE